MDELGLSVCDLEGELNGGHKMKKPCGVLYSAGELVRCELSKYQVCNAIQKVKKQDAKLKEYNLKSERTADI